jgi:hypothetical protein
MPVSETIKKQFMEYITLQAFDDQLIDRTEEKKIVEVGLKNNLTVEESLAIIREVAQQKGLVIERDAEDRAKEFLHKAATNDGQVSKKEFEDAVGLFKTATKGKFRDPDIKQRLKKMMLDNGWKAKEGIFSGGSWFSELG